MSIRFAAAGSGECAIVSRVIAMPRLQRAANDVEPQIVSDLLLQSALRHFAEFGLGAAEQARFCALSAHQRGDQRQYRHWLAVCQHLDRRMAKAIRTGVGNGAK